MNTWRNIGQIVATLCLAVMVLCSRYQTRAQLPDDYDSLGFVGGITQYSMADLKPHFPGYPVYLFSCKVMNLVLHDSLAAATLISVFAAGLCAVILGLFGMSDSRGSIGFMSVSFFLVSSLSCLLGGAALSESLALLLVLLAVFSQYKKWPILGAIAIGLMLGVRLSYFPIALSWLFELWRDQKLQQRKMALGALALSLLLWLLPWLLVVGKPVLRLAITHLHGHFTLWGGTLYTDVNRSARLMHALLSLCSGAFAPDRRILLVVGLSAALLLWLERRRLSCDLALHFTIWTLPYAVWVLVGQNVVEQPRHLLPLIAALLLAMGFLFSSRPWLGLPLCALIGWGASEAVWAQRHVLPLPLQMLTFLENHQSPTDTVLLGSRSLRFLHQYAPQWTVRERNELSEVPVELARLNVLPSQVLVTSELQADARELSQLHELAQFCRREWSEFEPRCLRLYRYSPSLGVR